MLYEQYAKKIRRLAQIRDNILRYKILILCSLAVILAAWTGFLITKGTITRQITGTDKYVYGDTLSFEAKALFSDITYEYNYGGQWLEKAPVMPGEYQVRAVSCRSFGRTNYSEPVTFVIDKKDVKITVAQRTVQWLELPELKAVGLMNGDSFEGAYVVMDMSGIGEKMADVDVSSTVIRNLDGEDITSAYNVLSASASVDVTPLRISVTPDSVEKIYDGTPIGVGGFSVTSGSLADGHSLSVELEVDDLVDVGSTKIKANNPVITADGVDITANYEVLCYQGAAKITAKNATLITGSYNKFYDGNSFSDDRTIGIDGTVEGDKLSVKDWNYPVDAGSYENLPTYSIVTERDGITVDITKNYMITADYGSLTIEKVKLEISVNDIEKTYDGITVKELKKDTQYSSQVTSGGQLRPDSELIVSLRNGVVNATRGKTAVTVDAEVWINNGQNITQNYDITVKGGYINIIPYSVDIEISDIEKVYDGVRVTPDYRIVSDNFLSFVSGLGHSSKISIDNDYINVGEYSYTLECNVNNGNQSMNDNYRFNIVGTDGNSSKIVISKRPFSYSTLSKTIEYNGAPQYNNTISYTGLALSSHYLRVDSYTQVTNVYWVDGKVQGKENEVTFTITDGNGKDVTANYEIECTGRGMITVLPRDINVQSVSLTNHYYDGAPMTGTDKASADRLVSSDKISVIEYVSPTNVKRGDNGEVLPYINEITFKILNSSGEDISYNYAWGDKEGYGGSLTFGSLWVNPRPLEIISDDVSKVYDRTPLLGTANGKGYTIGSNYGLVASHRLDDSTFSVTGKKTSVGTATNTITFNVDDLLKGIVFDPANEDVTYNYDVRCMAGRIEIKPISVSFTPNFVGVVYDGTPHSASTARLTSGKLLDGNKYWCVATGSMTDVGNGISNILTAVVFDDFGVCIWSNSRTSHYQFSDPTQPMYVKLGESTDYLRIKSDGTVELVSGISSASNYTMIHTDSDGERSTKGCYDITTKQGEIEIRKRKITIVCNNRTESYDKVKVLNGSWRISSGELAAGHTLYATTDGYVKEKGQKITYTVELDLIRVIGTDGNDHSKNYEFKIEDGTLELT